MKKIFLVFMFFVYVLTACGQTPSDSTDKHYGIKYYPQGAKHIADSVNFNFARIAAVLWSHHVGLVDLNDSLSLMQDSVRHHGIKIDSSYSLIKENTSSILLAAGGISTLYDSVGSHRSELNIIKDSLKAKVNSTLFNDLNHRVTDNEASLTILDTAIVNTVSKSDFTYSNHLIDSTFSSLEQKADGFTFDIQQLNSRITTAESRLDINESGISAEVTNRTNADNSLSGRLDLNDTKFSVMLNSNNTVKSSFILSVENGMAAASLSANKIDFTGFTTFRRTSDPITNNDITSIDGSKITTGAIMSPNYVSSGGTQGTFMFLTYGTLALGNKLQWDGSTLNINNGSLNMNNTFTVNPSGFMSASGATIEEKGTGNAKVVLDVSGLHAYDADNNQTVSINAGTGNASFKGSITGSDITGSSFSTATSGARVVMTKQYNQIMFYDANNNSVNLYSSPNGLEINGNLTVGGNLTSQGFYGRDYGSVMQADEGHFTYLFVGGQNGVGGHRMLFSDIMGTLASNQTSFSTTTVPTQSGGGLISNRVGTNTYVLTTPKVWFTVYVGSTAYKVPGY